MQCKRGFPYLLHCMLDYSPFSKRFLAMKKNACTSLKNQFILSVLALVYIICNPISSSGQCINPADLPFNILDVCFGEKVTFCPEVEEDVCYKWLPENAFLLGESSFPNPTTLPVTEDFEIQLIKTDDNGNILEEVTINVVINDFNLERIQIHEICSGEEITRCSKIKH